MAEISLRIRTAIVALAVTGGVLAGGPAFDYVVRHEVAHLHAGTDHFDPDFRALEARLVALVGYDLDYAPGAEYPQLVARPR